MLQKIVAMGDAVGGDGAADAGAAGRRRRGGTIAAGVDPARFQPAGAAPHQPQHFHRFLRRHRLHHNHRQRGTAFQSRRALWRDEINQ